MSNKPACFVLAILLLMAVNGRAQIQVSSTAPLVEDIGRCCDPGGLPGDAQTCAAGESPKCGWLFGDSEGAGYGVPVTAFTDIEGAHEDLGTIQFQATNGQLVGTQDTGDFDIATNAFSDGAGGWTTPDSSGRWVSGSCAAACRIDPIQALYSYALSDGTPSHWFYNYGFDADSSGYPPMSAIDRRECFRLNPADPATNAAGVNYVAPDVGCESAIFPDDWVAGSLVEIVLPYGVRLANTLYPGINLNGTNQFNAQLSGNTDGSFNYFYPAVVFSWEANHRLPGWGPNGNEPLPSPEHDRIRIFVPDILEELSTSPSRPSGFFLGETLFDTWARIPGGRDRVQQCYLNTSTLPCDYDTTISVDLRGADPVYRAASPVPGADRIEVWFESAPLIAFSPSALSVATVTARNRVEPMIADSTPGNLPGTGIYPDCYWYDDYRGNVLAPAPGDALLLSVPYETAVATPGFTESEGGYIEVDTGATTLSQFSTITCNLLDPDHVQFAEFDETSLNGACPYLCDWDWVNVPLLTPPGITCHPINTPGGPLVSITPAGSGMSAQILRGSESQIIAMILSESGPYTPATLSIEGLNLLFDEFALPAGGCIEMDCTVEFYNEEGRNHVGIANQDLADSGNPNQNNLGAAPGDHRPALRAGGESYVLPLTCLPGTTPQANTVGDANLDGTLTLADCALALSRHLGAIGAFQISPLALTDGDSDLDLTDAMLLGQATAGLRTVHGPGNLLLIFNPPDANATSGADPFFMQWTINSAYAAAVMTDGLNLGFELTASESRIAPIYNRVLLDSSYYKFLPINSGATQEEATVDMRLTVNDSSGAWQEDYLASTSVFIDP